MSIANVLNLVDPAIAAERELLHKVYSVPCPWLDEETRRLSRLDAFDLAMSAAVAEACMHPGVFIEAAERRLDEMRVALAGLTDWALTMMLLHRQDPPVILDEAAIWIEAAHVLRASIRKLRAAAEKVSRMRLETDQADEPAIVNEKGEPQKRRRTYERDHTLLRWKEEEGMTPAPIRERWNEENPRMKMTRAAVVKAIERAEKDLAS